MLDADAEDLLRRLTSRVLGAVARRYGHFDLAEDATQEALLAAARSWPRNGRPEDPKAWLIAVAARRLISMVDGPRAGLALLDHLEADPRMAPSRRFHAVRAHLLEQSGERAAALAAYETSASLTTNTTQQRYLQQQIERLREP